MSATFSRGQTTRDARLPPLGALDERHHSARDLNAPRSDPRQDERVRTTVSGAVDETCTSLPGACPERSRGGDSQSCTSGEPVGRFAGYERDNEYGLAHAPARYYSPTLGRFMTPDPLNGGVLQVSYPDPGVVTLAAMLSGHVLAPLGLSPTKRAPGPQVQSLGGQVPLAGPGCPGCGCTAGSNLLSNPQSLDRYNYVVNSPATEVDPSGAQLDSGDFCGFGCLTQEALCETECLFTSFLPPPFDFVVIICSELRVLAARSCYEDCGLGSSVFF